MFVHHRRVLCCAGIVAVFVSAWIGSAAQGQTKVLSGVPNFATPLPGEQQQRPSSTGPQTLSTVSLPSEQGRPLLAGAPVGGVPEYSWWYGCSPTSGGMMAGFWDGQPGRENLYKKGDAQVWSGNGSAGTARMVASDAHIISGLQNGYTYGDWHNSPAYPAHQDNPDCMADFMHTVNGGSNYLNIRSGLEAFCEWDDTSGYDMKDGYQATATLREVAYWGGDYTYQGFKTEIDAGRPVLLDVLTADPEWLGHSIVGYGYQDNMFDVKLPHSGANVTVGGFAVMDTWNNGDNFSEWVGWNYELVNPVLDGAGVEWWPFIEFGGSSWIYNPNPPYGPYDWMISEGIELNVVPEPAAACLLALGGLAVIRRRRRNIARASCP